MRQLQFEGEITEAARYALRYASDFYDVKEAKDFDSLFQINSRDFLNKCYEGYKISQDIIVRNILSIENELKVKQKELTNFKKGKHHKELYRDPVYKRLVENETQLRIQRAAFHEVANSIVWTVLLQERTHVKSFIQPGGGSGYLRDRNIDSVIAVAKNHNENPARSPRWRPPWGRLRRAARAPPGRPLQPGRHREDESPRRRTRSGAARPGSQRRASRPHRCRW